MHFESKRVLYLSLAGILCLSTAHAEPYEADLAIPEITENSEKLDGKLDGYHGRIVKQVIEKADLSFKTAPPTHAYNAFYDKKFLCITPDSRMYYGENSGFIDSAPFSSVNWVVVQRKGSSIISSAKELTGLKVGMFYPPEEIASVVPQKGVSYDVKANLTVNLLKVAFKRVDVAVLPETGLQDLIDGNGNLKNLSITLSPPLATVPEAIMCHDNAAGRAILKDVNGALKAIK